ncbi:MULTISPECIES: TIGR02281 family clan AA aspartic protease [unclassified Calothrix]|uniref:retropepsin-like aspartic protease family protein n=2 Tax=unclassified Calothrix TaxID=2619626 RepID=UPI002795FCFF|nr:MULTISPECIES: retropepsin-like aspartic protease [unclassified Calothrix]
MPHAPCPFLNFPAKDVDFLPKGRVKSKLIMLQSFLSRATLVAVTSALAVLGVACSQDKQNNAYRDREQSPPVDKVAETPVVEAATPLSSPEPQAQSSSVVELNSFELALDKAAGAMTISQSAQSSDDWKLVASQFQDAIALMQNIQQESPNFTVAQIKISEYQRQIKYALDKASPKPVIPVAAKPQSVVVVVPSQKNPSNPSQPPAPQVVKPQQPAVQSVLMPSPQDTEDSDVFIAPIKRRIGGTPIIEVTFNGERRFEMIVDTGASGTVITQNMANTLGIVPVGKTKANTASSKQVEFTIGYVDSMAAAGVMVNKVPVAIAGSDLETGLLGHDFFGNYDVTIKRNVVEFRPQSHGDINSPETGLTPPISPKERQYLGSP